MTNEKNGTHVSKLIIKNFNKYNRKIMTSSKLQINFYHLSMTKTNIYQYNTILPSLVWHHITKKMVGHHKVQKEACFFPRAHLLVTKP
jgi:hypothetical protein